MDNGIRVFADYGSDITYALDGLLHNCFHCNKLLIDQKFLKLVHNQEFMG